jgi:hypothetical protein
MQPEVSDRDLAALIEWLVTETNAGRLEWYETGVGSFSLIGDAGNIHLRRVTRKDGQGDLDSPADSMPLTNQAGKIYRQVGLTWPARTPSTPDQLLGAGRDAAFADGLATLFTAVHRQLEPQDPDFDLTDFVTGFPNTQP